jgi:large subunit ribosomal protein LP0
MSERVYPARKVEYIARMEELLDTHTKVFIVQANHVGSKQFSDIRLALRGKGTILMGKNTVMRRVIQNRGEDSPYWNLLPLLVGNIGLVFIKNSLPEVRDIIGQYVVPAPAKSGVEANANVIVPAGPTGCDPSQTSYFQAMEIPTKIQRGQIEISVDVKLVVKGDRVTAGQADLLNKLGIKPFTYGLHISQVFNDGAIFSVDILDITDDILLAAFCNATRDVAAIGHYRNVPNKASAMMSIRFGFRMLMALVCSEKTKHTFAQAADVQAYFADPTAFASSGGGGGAAATEEAVEEEAKEEEPAEVVANIFGGDEGDDAW